MPPATTSSPPPTRSRPLAATDGTALATLLLVGLLTAGLAACKGPHPPEREAYPKSPTSPESDESTRSLGGSPSERSEQPDSEASNSDDEDPQTAHRPHRLGAFFRALAETERDDRSRVTRILQVGDSHTASDTLTGRLRELFQNKFGGAGRGYAYPGVPWGSFRQEQMSYAASSEWETVYGTSDDAAPPFPAGGIRVETSNEEAWLERRACGLDREDSDAPDSEECTYGSTFDRFAVSYLVQKGGGSFTVKVDGAHPTVIETDGEESRVGIYRRGVDPGAHTIRIEAEGDGPVALFGIRTQSGDNGVEFSSLGINGATAPEFASFERRLMRQEIRSLDPDLLVFAFGTNAAYNLHRMHGDPDIPSEAIIERMKDYQFQFDRLIKRYRAAAPGASCLVVLPPDVAPVREDVECREKREVGGEEICIPPTIRHYAGIVAAQEAAAERRGCAVWSQSRAMGGAGSIQHWAALDPPLAQTDGIHLTMDGYHLLARAFFGDLMRAYSEWSEGGHAPLETRRIERPSRPKASRLIDTDLR